MLADVDAGACLRCREVFGEAGPIDPRAIELSHDLSVVFTGCSQGFEHLQVGAHEVLQLRQQGLGNAEGPEARSQPAALDRGATFCCALGDDHAGELVEEQAEALFHGREVARIEREGPAAQLSSRQGRDVAEACGRILHQRQVARFAHGAPLPSSAMTIVTL